MRSRNFRIYPSEEETREILEQVEREKREGAVEATDIKAVVGTELEEQEKAPPQTVGLVSGTLLFLARLIYHIFMWFSFIGVNYGAVRLLAVLGGSKSPVSPFQFLLMIVLGTFELIAFWVFSDWIDGKMKKAKKEEEDHDR